MYMTTIKWELAKDTLTSSLKVGIQYTPWKRNCNTTQSRLYPNMCLQFQPLVFTKQILAFLRAMNVTAKTINTFYLVKMLGQPPSPNDTETPWFTNHRKIPNFELEVSGSLTGKQQLLGKCLLELQYSSILGIIYIQKCKTQLCVGN